MDTSKIKLLLADNHAMVRTALHLLLEKEGFEIVGEAEDGIRTVRLAGELKPDMVILEIALPLLNGIEVTRQIKKEHKEVRVLICSAHISDEFITRLNAVHIDGYVLKHDPATDLFRAIHEIAAGNAFLSPTVATRMLARCNSSNSKNGDAPEEKYAVLTVREAEIVQLVAEGFSNKEIAGKLFISVKTVEKHRQQLMRKIGVHDRVNLTRYALEHGITFIGRTAEV